MTFFKVRTDGRHARPTKRSTDAGFSLTEIMVAVFIMALLSAAVVVSVGGFADDARDGRVESDLSVLYQSLENYKLTIGRYPDTDQGLEALVTPASDLSNPDRFPEGGFIPKLPDDPWGNPYQYVRPGEDGRPFDLFSFGADGRPGGEEADADRSYWGS